MHQCCLCVFNGETGPGHVGLVQGLESYRQMNVQSNILYSSAIWLKDRFKHFAVKQLWAFDSIRFNCSVKCLHYTHMGSLCLNPHNRDFITHMGEAASAHQKRKDIPSGNFKLVLIICSVIKLAS